MLLTRVGDGHTGYRASACIRANVDAYLLNLTVPATGHDLLIAVTVAPD